MFRSFVSESENYEFAAEKVGEHSRRDTADISQIRRDIVEDKQESVESVSRDEREKADSEEFEEKLEGNPVAFSLFAESPEVVDEIVLDNCRKVAENGKNEKKYRVGCCSVPAGVYVQKPQKNVVDDRISDDSETSGDAEAHELEFCQSIKNIL